MAHLDTTGQVPAWSAKITKLVYLAGYRQSERTRPQATLRLSATVPRRPASEPAHRVSPRGEQFEVVGRAGPVRLERTPYIPAEAREELLVVKEGDVFLCARPDGDIHHARVSGEGLYAEDTRHLSELRLKVGGVAPVPLSYVVRSGSEAIVEATNATLLIDGRMVVPQQSISIQRTLLISGRLYHLLKLRSFLPERVSTTIEVELATDFADVFEVREAARRNARGDVLAPRLTSNGLVLAYVGEDEQFRETIIEFDPQPATIEVGIDRAGAHWEIVLEPHETRSLLITVEPSVGGRRRPRRRLATAQAHVDHKHTEWEGSCTRFASDSALYDRLLTASIRDLGVLSVPSPGGEMIAAGIPWYVAPFGRDSLLTSLEALMLNPELARRTLIALAHMQAGEDDAWRDAEPGKILHELRRGELAGAGLIPHTPYYGTVDATPLFLIVAAAYHRWTLDLETLAALRPSLDAALRWIDEHGDADGDGFVEYERRSPPGLRNQGWKDSDDCVVHADGTLAEGPIALVEVQGYVYLAKTRIAEVYEALGEPETAERLRREAGELRAAFNEAFWDPQEGSFALALDGRKRQVRSVTSNAAHCLYCGVVEPGKAAQVAERLMAQDMFSGWGLRTLSSSSRAYNPMSYHNGSVWPHDNAIAASGLKRYGFRREAEQIATALFDVAVRARDYRLPELYCGFHRGASNAVVAYPVACIPQAWAAAAPFMLLQAMLGISARATEGVLTVNKPMLPPWLTRLDLQNLRIGDSSLSLSFKRDGDVTGFALVGQSGSIGVTLAA